MNPQERYLDLLERSYARPAMPGTMHWENRLEFLSMEVFDFTTYDSEMDEFFATKALEVCDALLNKTTFDYIKDDENHRWYLAMLNMDFFADKIDWGTSIRGAWFDPPSYERPAVVESCGLYDTDGRQILRLELHGREGVEAFIRAVLDFAKVKE